MPYLLGGLVILLGLMGLIYLFINEDPKRLARNLEWAVSVLGVLGSIGLILAERFPFLWLTVPLALVPAWRRLRPALSHATGIGQTATRYLRAQRDPESGAVTGTVIRGTFAGSRLNELARDELVMLLTECRNEDPAAAQLVEAHLDHDHPGWLDDLAEAGTHGLPTEHGDMTVGEARAILGVEAGANDTSINEAHRKLLRSLRGGSDYLVGKINRARDILLGQR